MKPDKMEKPPIPAYVELEKEESEDLPDVADPEQTSACEEVMDQEFNEFSDNQEESLRTQAVVAIHALCATEDCKSADELVSKPFPDYGPSRFMQEAELYAHLPNYEELVLKAVQSNSYAALILLVWFNKLHFFNMELYEEILKAAIETDITNLTKQGNLPTIEKNWKETENIRIENMKATRSAIEELISSDKFKSLSKLPPDYRHVAALDAKKLLEALNLVIDHSENYLEALGEIFAEKGEMI